MTVEQGRKEPNPKVAFFAFGAIGTYPLISVAIGLPSLLFLFVSGWGALGVLVALVVGLVPSYLIWVASKYVVRIWLRYLLRGYVLLGVFAVFAVPLSSTYFLMKGVEGLGSELMAREATHLINDPAEIEAALQQIDLEFGIKFFSAQNVVASSIYRPPALANEFQRDLIYKIPKRELTLLLNGNLSFEKIMGLPSKMLLLPRGRLASCRELKIAEFCHLEKHAGEARFLEKLNRYEGRSSLVLFPDYGLVWYQRNQW